MEIRFKNITAYNLNEYKKFIEFHASKYNFKYNIYTLFIVLLLLFCMILQFIYGKFLLAFLFIAILAIFIFYRIVHPLIVIKREANSNKIKQEVKNTYVFYDDFVTISDGKEIVKLKYSRFYKIFEKDNCFYLYLDKEHSYILLKNNFLIGNANDFYTFIKKKLWRTI